MADPVRAWMGQVTLCQSYRFQSMFILSYMPTCSIVTSEDSISHSVLTVYGSWYM